MTHQTQNSEELEDFTKFCYQHPHMRFWQALGEWSGHIIVAKTRSLFPGLFVYDDTYYWQGRSSHFKKSSKKVKLD